MKFSGVTGGAIGSCLQLYKNTGPPMMRVRIADMINQRFKIDNWSSKL